jgi:hypothetical protein
MKSGWRGAMIGMFLAAIAVPPLVQTGIEAASGRTPQVLSLFRTRPSEANLRAFERELEQASWLAGPVRRGVQDAWWRWFGYGGEQVAAGRDGWLFYRQDVRYLVEPAEGSPPLDAWRAILDFRDQLAARGIALLVCPAPSKAAVYPERLTRHAPRKVTSPTIETLRHLREAGVETMDWFQLFQDARRRRSGEPYYLRLDTHWTAETARLAAEATGRRVLELGWLPGGVVDYHLRPVHVSRSGDLARMLGLEHPAAGLGRETVACHQVVRSDTGERYQDDPASPVLVLGDSFLQVFQADEPLGAGWIAQLARVLRRPVTSLVRNGGGATLVRQELSRRPALLAGKRVVIWEFAERDLRFGMEGWQRVPLPPADPLAPVPIP